MKKVKKEVNKIDFTLDSLPLTRRKQFFDILKNEWRTLLLLSLIALVFAIPYITCVFLEMSLSDGTSYAMSQQGKTAEEIALQLAYIHRIFSGINVISFCIFSVFIAGATRIIKKLCLGDVIMGKRDFFEGIKLYWKRFLLAFLVNGFILFVIEYISSVLLNSSSSILSNGVRGVTLGIYFAIILPISLFNLTQYTFYDLPFIKRSINSFRFVIVKYYFVIIFSLVLLGFYFITLIPSFLISIIISILFIIIIPVIFSTCFYLYSLSFFDKYINKNAYPEIYRKGLRKIKE